MSKLAAKPTRIETSFVIVTDIQSERMTSVTVVAKTEQSPPFTCFRQPLLRHLLGEQRRIQIVVGMGSYRGQGPKSPIGHFIIGP